MCAYHLSLYLNLKTNSNKSIISLQAAEIQQQTVAMDAVPEDCRRGEEDEEEGWFDISMTAFRGLFTFQKDNCQKYYEHMLIDPLLRVPPTKVGAHVDRSFITSTTNKGRSTC